MEIKERISSFINQLLLDYKLTQRDLAALIGIKSGRLAAYLKAKETPRIEVIMKLAEIGGLTVDDLLKTNKAPEEKEIVVNISDKATVGAGVVQGDFTLNQNTTIKRTYRYTYSKGDLTDAQAAKLKVLVDEIIELENAARKVPKSYAAVWNALKKKFKVPYYRRIREEDFDKAVVYFQGWKGRLLRAKRLPKKEGDLHRKNRYKSIFAIATKELGWRKTDVDNFIYAKYEKASIKDLDAKELDKLYGQMRHLKKKG